MRKTHNGSPGLWTASNSELSPPGALKQATACAVKRSGLLQKLTPLRQYSTATFGSPQGLFYYGTRFYARTATQLHAESGTGTRTFAALTLPSGASIAPADSGDTLFVRVGEINANAYVSTAKGFLKLDAAGANPYMAGVPRALDVQLSLVASGSLLANTNSVGYRVVFGFQDANKNLILGPPSGRATVTASAAQNVGVKTWIPTGIYSAANATSYFYQVYRTPVTTIAGVDPGEEMQLVYQAYLTATDVSNRYVSFTDALPDAIRGAALYTNPSQEGIAQANYPPPIATDIAAFKGAMFYSNTTGKHRARLQMLGTAPVYTISTAAGGITKSGGSGIVTLTGSPDLTSIPTDGTAYISISGATTAANNGDFPITGVVAGTSITYTNAAAFTEAGAAGARCVATKLTIAGSNYYASLIAENTSSPYRYLVTTSGGVGTASTNVLAASQSLLRVVNQTNANVYGYYESGPDDGAGKMLFEEQGIGGSSFTISGAGLVFANCFAPAIQTASLITSSNDAAANRLYFSKPGQPEHVPLANYYDIGSRSAAILRILPLREALLVFKEDGLFRVTGDGAAFAVAPFDPTVVLVARNSVTVAANSCWAFTSRGALRITESAATSIDESVSEVFRAARRMAYAQNTHVTASEADGCVYFYLYMNMLVGAYTTSNRCMVYSIRTGGWSEAPVGNLATPTYDAASNLDFWATPAISVGGYLYRMNVIPGGSGDGSVFYEDSVSQTEATALGAITAGEASACHKYTVSVTASNAGAHTVTLSNPNSYPIAVGYLLADRGGANVYRITNYAAGVATVAIAYGTDTFAFSAGSVSVYVPIYATIEWVPYTAGDDSAMKRFREVTILLDGASTLTTATVQMYTEATTATTVAAFTSTNSPTPSGISTLTALRCLVPLNMQQARRLSVILTHNTVGEFMFVRGIAYEFDVLSDANAVT